MPHIKNALIRYRIIDKCIRNQYKPFPSKRDLREACEESLFGSTGGAHICDSTIEKDMYAMKMEHDAPIKYSKLEKGYFYEDKDFTLNDIPLTDNDMEAISFAAHTLMQFKDVDLFRQFGSAIDKIVDHLAVSQDQDSQQFVQFEATIADGGNEYLTSILEAIKLKRLIQFEYASFVTGELKLRKVTPLLLKQYRNRWYLISFDDSKNDYITYALDRIEGLEILKETVSQPIDFDPDNYFKHAVGITSGNTAPTDVRLKVSLVAAKYLDSLPIHASQKVVEMNQDHFIFCLKVNISEELIREIMSYGGDIAVIEPLELKEEVQRRANRFLT
ncbi:MAG: WYL domain-containing protein [Crocinitomicaceae bacterium]|jgi:predicted DNA-binding transcriptional regulator YafY|nr:WYL domain-containing protein [Crocinitomicaceae bacterium]MDA9881467.1 WYL domain-containing protein [Crocinitomicaceae bacterium]MDG1035344.1 WYL domain-containing protein [Crocinitomicaceae bacterium]MDG1740997.1 WYL domain-containing protein [Crocinitomicaceae bacterium]